MAYNHLYKLNIYIFKLEGPLIWIISNISRNFDQEFRDIIYKKNNGIRKGDLRKAVIEAVEEWMERQEIIIDGRS